MLGTRQFYTRQLQRDNVTEHQEQEKRGKKASVSKWSLATPKTWSGCRDSIVARPALVYNMACSAKCYMLPDHVTLLYDTTCYLSKQVHALQQNTLQGFMYDHITCSEKVFV